MHFTSQRFTDASSYQDEIYKRRQHLASAGHLRHQAEAVIKPDPKAMMLNGSFFICGCHYFADGHSEFPVTDKVLQNELERQKFFDTHISSGTTGTSTSTVPVRENILGKQNLTREVSGKFGSKRPMLPSIPVQPSPISADSFEMYPSQLEATRTLQQKQWQDLEKAAFDSPDELPNFFKYEYIKWLTTVAKAPLVWLIFQYDSRSNSSASPIIETRETAAFLSKLEAGNTHNQPTTSQHIFVNLQPKLHAI